MKRSLNATAVLNAKPRGTAYKLFDGGGLYLFVSKTGSRSWRYKYRYSGKELTYTIGTYPELSLADARQVHVNARLLLTQGTNPIQQQRSALQKKVSDSENTFEAVAREYLLKKSTKGDPAKRWTSGYSLKNQRILEQDVFPKIGSILITEVGAAELSHILESVAERKKVRMPHQQKIRIRERGATSTALQILYLCRGVFKYASARGIARFDSDPTWALSDLVSKPAVKHHGHLLLEELAAFWRDLENVAANTQVKIAMELLALTFVRTGELRLAEWAEFDLEGKGKHGPHWCIPAHKMKKRREHMVPLSARAIQLLKALKEISGDGPLLFPNRHRPAVPMNPNTINQVLYRMGYAGKLSGHGFRGTASTALHERGFSPHAIEAQLAHQVSKDRTAASYNHAVYWAERVAIMTAWAGMLRDDVDNVVPLRRIS